MTALTDPDDRHKLSALALVAAGLLVATAFIWLQLAVLRPPGGGALMVAPAAVAESAAAGVAREVRQ